MKYETKAHGVLVTNGAKNIALEAREPNDYYATEPKAIDLLLEQERFAQTIWEPACGEGHMSERLKHHGYTVISTDLIDRGYGETLDFFSVNTPINSEADIITNPPYKCVTNFVRHAVEMVDDGIKVAMFLKIQFLETQERRQLFDLYPPKTIYVSSKRLRCAKNGMFTKAKLSNAICYAWYVWVKGWKGDTCLKWIN